VAPKVRAVAPQHFDAWSLREAAEALLLVTAAREVGLLEELARERTPEEAAEARGLDARAVGVCLAALEAIGVVERGQRGFRLSPFGRSRFADPASTSYVAGELDLWRAGLPGWLFLDEVLRSGRGLPQARGPEVEARLCRALDDKPAGRVAAVVEDTLARATPQRPRVLDLGGGSGPYARALVAAGCHVTLLDRPDVIRHVREAFGLDRIAGLDLVEGDFTAGLPAGPFDIVLCADVLHELRAAEARALLARASRVVGSEGVVGVVDLFRGRSGRAALYAVTLLLYGDGGDTHAAGDVVSWLETAGFGEARFRDLDAGRSLLTAVRGRAAPRESG
jgi:hypothetical protein